MLDIVRRFAKQILGVLSCFDRVILKGSIPPIRYAKGMTSLLRSHGYRIFDYTKWAEPLRDEIKANAERMAKENGLTIEYLNSTKKRKDKIIKKVLKKRGHSPGLVHIFSIREPCHSYYPWHDKSTGETYLKYTDGYCLHYYFYFIDKQLGLCYLRVPTWAPFQLQFYFNGHNLVASRLRDSGIDFKMIDNAFVRIDDFNQAQRKAKLPIRTLRRLLDDYALVYCPVTRHFDWGYDWGIMQAEYATDIVFRRKEYLKPFYDRVIRTAIHTIKPGNVATFLGRKIHGNFKDEIDGNFHTRIEGTRIKHHMGSVSIKMYDKFGAVLRIETTVNDVTFFKHYRRVEHRDGTWSMQNAEMKKTIYSLPALQDLLGAANRRYLEFISALEDPSSGYDRLESISQRICEKGHSYRGFNLFGHDDLDLFEAIVRGEFLVSGFRNCNIRALLKGKSAGQVGRMLKRLHTHKLIRKIGKTYKYYLTKLGREVVLTALKIRELDIIPALAY